MSKSDAAPAVSPPSPLTIAAVDPDVMEALGEALDELTDGEAPGA